MNYKWVICSLSTHSYNISPLNISSRTSYPIQLLHQYATCKKKKINCLTLRAHFQSINLKLPPLRKSLIQSQCSDISPQSSNIQCTMLHWASLTLYRWIMQFTVHILLLNTQFRTYTTPSSWYRKHFFLSYYVTSMEHSPALTLPYIWIG